MIKVNYKLTKLEKSMAITIGALFGILIITGITNVVTMCNLINSRPQTKPCECPSLSHTLSNVAKYEMYVDSLENSSKKQRERLTDSLVKYYNALRVNENPINIEK